MVLVDTNVLIDVLEDDPVWAEWSIQQLRMQSRVSSLAINPVIYAELASTFSTFEALDDAIEEMGLTVLQLPKPALFVAGKAFARYRKSGGSKGNVLADFFIGAHSAVERFPLLTRDTKRYRSYFPTVELISPS